MMADILRVLYVDDEQGLLNIGKLFLEREGMFTVDTLTSVREALARLHTERYDAIISDYQMPEVDGITFLKQLKASGNQTPFIIFTGRGREEVVIEALNSGADFYIQKGGEPKAQFTELAYKIQSAVNRQRTEKHAKDTERRLYDIINFLPDATFAIDKEGKVIAWNKAIEEMTGVPACDMIGKGNYEYSLPFYGEHRPILIDLVSIPDEELTQNRYAIIKKEGGILIAETTLPRPLGRYSVLLGKASYLYNDEGEIIGAIESIRDITEQRHAQEELRKAHDEYVDLLDHIEDVYYRSDAQGRLILASKSWAKDLGYDDLSDCLGKNIADTFYVDPCDRKRFLNEVYRTGSVSDYEVVLKKKDGSPLPVATSSYLYFDESGKVQGVEGTWRDITERKSVEAALQESEEKYRTLVEKANEAIMIAQDDVFVFANNRMSELLGVAVKDLEGKPFIDYIWPDDRELVVGNYRKRLSGETIRDAYDFRITGARGRVTWVFLSAAVIQWKGRPATLNLLTDITDRKLAEEALREREEMLRLKLDSVLSPEVDPGEQDLANIIDTVSIQSMMDDFHALTGMPIGIVDLQGNVLVKAGWQEICTKFHRVHPETRKNCIESNIALSSGVAKGEFRAYRCKNNMWDIVTPIFISDKHIGNLFCGQFFYEDEVPDHQVFIIQAEKYGFDTGRYRAALDAVPRWSREKVTQTMHFYAKFAELVSKLSFSNLNLAKMISTQKLVETALMDSEEQSRMLLSQLPDIVMVHQDGIIVYVNQTAVDMTGYTRAELIGSHLFDYVVTEYQKTIIRNMARRASGERVGDYEVDIRYKAGDIHHIIARTSPIVFNLVPSVLTILIDISERKRAEKALRESEEKYRLIFEYSPLGHLSFDEKGIIVACNDKFIQIIGSSREALIGLNMLELPDKKIVSAVEKALNGSPGLYEGVYTSVTGKKTTPVRGLFAPINLGDGRIPGGVGIFEDITGRKQAEEALRESEEKYRRLFETMMDAFVSVDMTGVIQETNNSFNVLLGYTADELRQLSYKDATPEKWHAFESDIVNNQIMVRGYSDVYEKEYTRKDGITFPVELRTFLMKDGQGNAVGMWAIVRDITGRKLAEEAVAESEEKFRATIGQSRDGILITDGDFRIIEWNDTQTAIYGHTREEMLGRSLWEFQFDTMADEKKSPFLLEKMKQSLLELPTLPDVSWMNSLHDFVVQSKDGQCKTVQISTFPIVFRNRKFLGSFSRDITGRKQAEEALREANKKLNLLSNITCHDISNQLMVLLGYMAILEDSQLDPSQDEYCRNMTAAAERISNIIQFTKEYGQIGVHAPTWQDCHTLVDTAAKEAPIGKLLVKNDLPAGTEVFADPLVAKVFYNLMDNAVRYGGKITTLRYSADESGDDPVIICEDDGDGVPVLEKERIFERGFGKNTGLGLALSREILDITGITIRETGEPGAGARFEITVPKRMWRSGKTD